MTQKTPAQRARKALILFLVEVSIGAWIGHVLAGMFASEHPIVWAWVYGFAAFPVGWEIMRAEFQRTCFDEGGLKSEVGGIMLLLVAAPVGAIMMIPTAIARVLAVLDASKPPADPPISFADERQRRGKRSA